MNHIRRACALCLIATALLAASCCKAIQKELYGTKVAGVALQPDGLARQAPATLPAGATLHVVLLYDVTFERTFDAHIELSLLRAGLPIATQKCTLLKRNMDDEHVNLDGVVSPTSCEITVPPAGADGMEASYHIVPADGAVYHRLEVALYAKD